MKTKYILSILFLVAISSQTYSASFVWVGTTSSAWSVSGNWSGGGGGTPGTGDNITINSNTPNNLILTQNRAVTGFSITGDTIDLGGYELPFDRLRDRSNTHGKGHCKYGKLYLNGDLTVTSPGFLFKARTVPEPVEWVT